MWVPKELVKEGLRSQKCIDQFFYAARPLVYNGGISKKRITKWFLIIAMKVDHTLYRLHKICATYIEVEQVTEVQSFKTSIIHQFVTYSPTKPKKEGMRKLLNRNYSTQSKNLKTCFEIALITCLDLTISKNTHVKDILARTSKQIFL